MENSLEGFLIGQNFKNTLILLSKKVKMQISAQMPVQINSERNKNLIELIWYCQTDCECQFVKG